MKKVSRINSEEGKDSPGTVEPGETLIAAISCFVYIRKSETQELSETKSGKDEYIG